MPSELPIKHRSGPDEEEGIDQVGESSGLPEESSEERTSAKRSFFPSAMDRSFFLATGAENLTDGAVGRLPTHED